MRFIPFRRAWSSWGLLAFALLVTGCPTTTKKAPAPTATCVTRYAQCQMPDGPLGVCNDAPCAEGQATPCFKCVSQH